MIIACYETFDGREHNVNSDNERSYVRTFNVVSNLRAEDPIIVRLAPGLPPLYSPYINTVLGISDLYSWCREIRVRQDTLDPSLWRVTLQYSNKIDRPDQNQVENPLLRPSDVSYDTLATMIPMEWDADSTPVLNSAGEKFDPPLERERHVLTISIKVNWVAFNALAMLDYKGRTNSETWWGFPRGQVFLAKLSASRAWENGVFYFPVQFEFHVAFALYTDQPATDFWAKRVLDQGYYEKIDGKLKIIKDVVGNNLTKPALLNGSGRKLAVGADPVWRVFYIYQEADFNELDLRI